MKTNMLNCIVASIMAAMMISLTSCVHSSQPKGQPALPSKVSPSPQGQSDRRIQEYLSTIQEFAQDPCFAGEGLAESAAAHWEYSGVFNIGFANDAYWCYRCEERDYAGGAHGNTTVKVGCVIRATGRKMLVQDLAGTPAARAALLEAIRTGIANHFQCATYDEAREEFLIAEPPLTENFYATTDGLVFVFQEYEIGPHSAGVIEIPVAWNTSLRASFDQVLK